MTTLSCLAEEFADIIERLSNNLDAYNLSHKNITKAKYCKNTLLADMEALREVVDKMELITGKDYTAFPTYEDILYSVKY